MRRPVHRLGDVEGERKRRLDARQFGELNRTSIMSSKEFADIYGRRSRQGAGGDRQGHRRQLLAGARWPDLGDRWGIILEELVTGTRTDIQGGLDELDAFAKELVAKRD